MSHELYISDWCRKAGYTPENDYDPRYYDIGYERENDEELYNDILATLNNKCGLLSYQLMCFDEVIYTNNFNVMRIMQDDFNLIPVWVDIAGDDISTVDELEGDGWTW